MKTKSRKCHSSSWLQERPCHLVVSCIEAYLLAPWRCYRTALPKCLHVFNHLFKPCNWTPKLFKIEKNVRSFTSSLSPGDMGLPLLALVYAPESWAVANEKQGGPRRRSAQYPQLLRFHVHRFVKSPGQTKDTKKTTPQKSAVAFGRG